jgi:hypothetical protein
LIVWKAELFLLKDSHKTVERHEFQRFFQAWKNHENNEAKFLLLGGFSNVECLVDITT